MTKLEKNKVFVLEDMENQTWLKKDRWGNFIFNDDNTLRYHPKKSVICKQRKINTKWVTMKSIYYKDMIKNIKNNTKE